MVLRSAKSAASAGWGDSSSVLPSLSARGPTVSVTTIVAPDTSRNSCGRAHPGAPSGKKAVGAVPPPKNVSIFPSARATQSSTRETPWAFTSNARISRRITFRPCAVADPAITLNPCQWTGLARNLALPANRPIQRSFAAFDLAIAQPQLLGKARDKRKFHVP